MKTAFSKVAEKAKLQSSIKQQADSAPAPEGDDSPILKRKGRVGSIFAGGGRVTKAASATKTLMGG